MWTTPVYYTHAPSGDQTTPGGRRRAENTTPDYTRQQDRQGPQKPKKPYKDFPLFPHAAGVWAKKIRGKLHYFGPWSDPDGALKLYQEQRDDLYAGRKPRKRDDPESLEVRTLVNAFLTHKGNQRDSGELEASSFASDYQTCAKVVEYSGARRLVSDLAAEDFSGLRAEMAKTLGLRELGKRLQEVCSLFKYGYDSELAANLGHLHTLVQLDLRPTQLVDDLLRTVTLLGHDLAPVEFPPRT